jgi:hypothetical protein
MGVMPSFDAGTRIALIDAEGNIQYQPHASPALGYFRSSASGM